MCAPLRSRVIAVVTVCAVAATGGAAADPARKPPPSDEPDYKLLRATQETFRGVAAKLRPSLVRIETVGGAQPSQRLLAVVDEGQTEPRRRLQNAFRDAPGSDFAIADGPTTGLVYSADGYIVTSSFNFVREPLVMWVTLADGRRLAATLVARDRVRKIALLKVDAGGLSVPEWAEQVNVEVGQWAVALGLGFGGEEPSVTVGIISAMNRMHGNALQTDAKLSPANYGGPLCDIDGRVVGISVPMAQRPGELAGVEFYDSGIGFAVPTHRLDEIVAVLRTGRSFHRGWLGIQIDGRVAGAVGIGRIAVPSPMYDAGVMPGDVILAANGKEVRHFGELVHALYMLPAGERVDLLMERDESSYQIEVTLARSMDLGPLPNAEEPFDPAEPWSTPDEE